MCLHLFFRPIGATVGTFGIINFSFRGAENPENPGRIPQLLIPYWKIDYFLTQFISFEGFHLKFTENRLKSPGDG